MARALVASSVTPGTRIQGPFAAAHISTQSAAHDCKLPTTGGLIEGQFIPNDDPSVPLSVKLGKSGHVVYALAAMLKMGFRIVECTPAERAIMEARGITLAC
jgi:hypothetical protein